MQIDQNEFSFFVKFLSDTSGYSLMEDKKYLLEMRLEDVLKLWKIGSYGALVSEISRNPHSKIALDVIEAMTINETFFFRDQMPFETFEQHLLPLLAERGKAQKLRIWSSACSTGQEPYSIAMIIEENLSKYPGLQYEIIGTDINNRVLSKARQGIYTDLEVHRGLPEKYRQKYFKKDGSTWHISSKITCHTRFQQLNLRGPFTIEGVFDFVMLRNVLIYFDPQTKEDVLKKVSQKMRPGSFLLLGAAESIYDKKHYFQRCKGIQGLFEFMHAERPVV